VLYIKNILLLPAKNRKYNMEDTFKLQGKRKQLVDDLKKKGITDTAVLDALQKVPRHFFIAKGLEEKAYEDVALPIASEQTISQPYTVAFQSQLLEVKSNLKILEIGTGSGYQAAILSTMGANVYSIERHEALYKSTSVLLRKKGYRVNLFYGDGYKGLPTYGPFDRILITAAAPIIPDDLKTQLKTGGILIVPLGEGGRQVMTKLVKNKDDSFSVTEHDSFAFVPMLKGKVSDNV